MIADLVLTRRGTRRRGHPAEGAASSTASAALRLGELLVRAARVTASALVSMLLATAALGWLYALGPLVARWPGPRLAMLPLDALAGKDRLPLAAVVVVLGSCCALSAGAARALRLTAPTAAAVLGSSTGGWTMLTAVLSYAVVRQQGVAAATAEALAAPGPYLAAAIAAIAGAVVARRHPSRGARRLWDRANTIPPRWRLR